MAISAVSVVRGPGELAVMVVRVARLVFTTRFQTREFIEQAWFVTKVSALPTALFTIPFGATIALLLAELARQFGAQHQVVDEEADQGLQLAPAAARHGRAHEQLALPRVAVKQGFEGREQNHEQGRALAAAECLEPAREA